MVTKYGKVVTYGEGLPPIGSHKPYIFTITIFMVTQIVRVVTCREEFPTINSHDS